MSMTLCRRALTSRATSGGAPQISLLVTSCHSIGLIIFVNILHTMAYLVSQHQLTSSDIGRETHKIWSDVCLIRPRSSYRNDSTLNRHRNWGEIWAKSCAMFWRNHKPRNTSNYSDRAWFGIHLAESLDARATCHVVSYRGENHGKRWSFIVTQPLFANIFLWSE
jgi:hypothetical protein